MVETIKGQTYLLFNALYHNMRPCTITAHGKESAPKLVNYSIIEAGLRALADKAHESAVAQAEGKPIPCGLSEGDMELVALLTAMMNDTQANKGWCAHEMGKSISSFEKYVHDGKIPEGIHDQFGHEKKWNKSLIRYFANKKAFFRKLSRKYGINL